MTTVQRTIVLHKRSGYQNYGIYIGADIPWGIYIVTVEPDSPAAATDLQPGDRVLAFNGQLVSNIGKNPKEILAHVAANSNTLTLSVQSTHVLQSVDAPTYNQVSRYSTVRKTYSDGDDLEGYVRSLLGDETLSVLHVSSADDDKDPRRSHNLRKRRRQQRRRNHPTKDDQKENKRPSPQKKLSNAQLNLSTNPDIGTDNKDDPPPYQSTTPDVQKTLPSFNGEGVHEVKLQRLPDFQGFGFHVQFNNVYYIMHQIEEKSPAEIGGLKENDVVLLVNDQSTEGMSYQKFVEIVSAGDEVVFVTQPFDDYFRANPHVPPNPNVSTAVTDNTNETEKRSILSKALNKLTSREKTV